MEKNFKRDFIASAQIDIMRFLKYLISAVLTAFALPVFCQPLVTDNPLLVHSNHPIAWDKVNADVIRNAVEQVVQISDKRVANIIAAVKPGNGPSSTLVALDLLFYDIYDLDTIICCEYARKLSYELEMLLIYNI